jgi:hypothetical protein
VTRAHPSHRRFARVHGGLGDPPDPAAMGSRHGVEQEGKETADGTLVIEEDVPVRLEGGSEVQFPRVRTASATNTAPRTAG